MFLDCLRRFISRRGQPKSLIGDNASQFRLVKSTLDWQWTELFKSDELRDFLGCESIEWSFTTALAPWLGGFYKHLIGMVKQSLKRGMGCKVLYWDKLTTLLVEVEAIINRRPLMYVGEDFDSSFVLISTHFLTGNQDVIPSCLDYSDDVDYFHKMHSVKELSKHWKRSQKQLNLFGSLGSMTICLALHYHLFIGINDYD